MHPAHLELNPVQPVQRPRPKQGSDRAYSAQGAFRLATQDEGLGLTLSDRVLEAMHVYSLSGYLATLLAVVGATLAYHGVVARSALLPAFSLAVLFAAAGVFSVARVRCLARLEAAYRDADLDEAAARDRARVALSRSVSRLR